MCIDAGIELNYLHNEMEVQKMLIHGDTKIVRFRHSVLHNEDYMDPEFYETGMLCKESDVFGFGVLMFEMLCGQEVSEVLKNLGVGNQRIADIVSLYYLDKRQIKYMIANELKGENGDSKFFLQKGPNEDSLNTFMKIIWQCVLETRNKRPTMKTVVQELEKALTFQKNHKDKFRMSVEDIKSATQDFSHVIGGGGFGCVYKGQLVHRSGEHYAIAAKKLDTRHGQGDKEFYTELQILYEYKHQNIIGLVGYSNETTEEKIIVYEHASKGSLNKHLSDASLTWRNRLKICIDFATGLDFLHGGVRGRHAVIHRDIKSSNILLFDDWKAKVGDFGLSMITTLRSNDKDDDYTIDSVSGTLGYVDPLYLKSDVLTKKSDIYSFGVVLFEILCGKTFHEISKHKSQSLLGFIKHNFEEEGKRDDEVVFKAIKEEIVPISLTTYLNILYRCLDDDPKKRRPSAEEVLAQLQMVLEFQERGSNLRMSREDIKLATRNFRHTNEIGRGSFWRLYKGVYAYEDGKGHHNKVVAKRFDKNLIQGRQQFYKEFQIVYEYRHENVIRLVGYSNEMDEKIIVYEHASKGSLDKYLNDDSLTWRNRLNICIDFATGLDFLHGCVDGNEAVVHGNINTRNILLFEAWKAKVGGFALSSKIIHTIDVVRASSMLTMDSDVYSFGVVLFEILCGKTLYEIHRHESESLLSFIKRNFEKGKRGDEVVFKAIKGEIVPMSLTTYLNILYQCLDDDPKKRPSAKEVLAQLQKALEFQDDTRGCIILPMNCLSFWHAILD